MDSAKRIRRLLRQLQDAGGAFLPLRGEASGGQSAKSPESGLYGYNRFDSRGALIPAYFKAGEAEQVPYPGVKRTAARLAGGGASGVIFAGRLVGYDCDDQAKTDAMRKVIGDAPRLEVRSTSWRPEDERVHFYFRWPDGDPLPASKGSVPEVGGCQFKAAGGGYFVAPGSVVTPRDFDGGGEPLGCYSPVGELTDAPKELVRLTLAGTVSGGTDKAGAPPRYRGEPTSGDGIPTAEGAVEDAVDRWFESRAAHERGADGREGTRNAEMWKMVYAIVSDGCRDESQLGRAMDRLNSRFLDPLPPAELERDKRPIIRWALGRVRKPEAKPSSSAARHPALEAEAYRLIGRGVSSPRRLTFELSEFNAGLSKSISADGISAVVAWALNEYGGGVFRALRQVVEIGYGPKSLPTALHDVWRQYWDAHPPAAKRKFGPEREYSECVKVAIAGAKAPEHVRVGYRHDPTAPTDGFRAQLREVGAELRYNELTSAEEVRFTDGERRGEWREVGNDWLSLRDRMGEKTVPFAEYTPRRVKPPKVNSGAEAFNANLSAVAQSRKVNPFLDWLRSLPDSVGEPGDLISACRAMMESCFDIAEPDRERAGAGLRTVLLAAARRQLEPGTKADSCLTLIGPQGQGKSTFLRKLLPDDSFFAEGLQLNADEGRKIEKLRGAVIVEISELAGVLKADIGRTDSFLSATTDRYRLAYRRNPESMPRRCVLVGTTNKERTLAVEVGQIGRRYIPVRLGRKKGMSASKVEYACASARGLLWSLAFAEAKRLRPGAEVALPSEYWLANEAAVNEHRFRSGDDEERVAAYVRNNWSEATEGVLLAKHVVAELAGESKREANAAEWNRLSRVVPAALLNLGFENRYIRIAGRGRKRCWAIRPERIPILRAECGLEDEPAPAPHGSPTATNGASGETRDCDECGQPIAIADYDGHVAAHFSGGGAADTPF